MNTKANSMSYTQVTQGSTLKMPAITVSEDGIAHTLKNALATPMLQNAIASISDHSRAAAKAANRIGIRRGGTKVQALFNGDDDELTLVLNLCFNSVKDHFDIEEEVTPDTLDHLIGEVTVQTSVGTKVVKDVTSALILKSFCDGFLTTVSADAPLITETINIMNATIQGDMDREAMGATLRSYAAGIVVFQANPDLLNKKLNRADRIIIKTLGNDHFRPDLAENSIGAYTAWAGMDLIDANSKPHSYLEKVITDYKEFLGL